MPKTLSKPGAGRAAGRNRPTRMSTEPEPVWEVANLFPAQGLWSEEDYLQLDGNRLVEFSDGRVEVLAMPTTAHQRIVKYLLGLLLAFTTPARLGEVLFAPVRVRLRRGRFREPDIVFMHARHARRIRDEFWVGADLVMEVVSDDEQSRRRDLVTKRREYAAARIPEYWIVDPRERSITVLRLRGTRYVLHGRFGAGDHATSATLRGFAVEVDAVFAAARG